MSGICPWCGDNVVDISDPDATTCGEPVCEAKDTGICLECQEPVVDELDDMGLCRPCAIVAADERHAELVVDDV